MRHSLTAQACAMALAALSAAAPAAISAGPKDTLDLPAAASAMAASKPLTAIARAGKRLVAVGQRGHILYSDDGGQQWTQATVPLSTDLTAVHFPTPALGWAVGHDGTVLHSADGGRTWTRQLDGRQAAQIILSHYGHSPRKEEPAIAAAIGDARRMQSEGADQPFLNVYFENAREGYIIGAFNQIFSTRDGGRHWTPIMEQTDNPQGYHLYGIAAAGDELYIAGELGLLMKLERASGRFTQIATPYKGTYFGVLAKDDVVLVYGLRGNAYRSTDAGASWQKVDTGVPTALNAATLLDDGAMALGSQGGDVLVSANGGASFQRLPGVRPQPVYALAPAGPGTLALTGFGGARTARLAPAGGEQ